MDTILAIALVVRPEFRLHILMLAYYEEYMLHASMPHTRLIPETLSDEAFVKFFRFERGDVPQLLVALKFPLDLGWTLGTKFLVKRACLFC